MILNLANLEKSDIKYKIFSFPDGEVQIELLEEIDRKHSLDVYCRICNADDLFILMQVGDILDRQGIDWILNISYLMSMRMDRVMSFNRPYSLKVVTKMLNSLNPFFYSVLEAHSPKTGGLMKGKGMIYPNSFEASWNNIIARSAREPFCLVLPDEGALHRYAPSCDYICFSKKRDLETGKILSFVPNYSKCSRNNKRFVFVDDLCDGGGTFLGELEILKEKFPDATFELFVTHAVNEIGLKKVTEAFDKVYVTNSYRDWTPSEKLEVIEVI